MLTQPDDVLTTTNLSKSYGRTFSLQTLALQEVNLRVPAGGVYALLGPNGAGKSTALSLVLGLLKPSSGQVTLFGQPWQRSLLARVGASINGPAFYGHLSARENLEVHARLLELAPKAVTEALSLAGLNAGSRQPAGRFSTGMKSRLALATALLGEPELLILDEPQNGLDPEGIRELREFLRRYVKPERAGEGARTVLVSSHLLAEVAQLATVVGVMARGQLRYQGELAGLGADGAELERAYFKLTEPMTAQMTAQKA